MGHVQRTIVQDEVAFLLSLTQARRITEPQFAICPGSLFLRARRRLSLNQEIVRVAATKRYANINLRRASLHPNQFRKPLGGAWLRAFQFVNLIIS
jgi:hypothetical protein